ncbi:uncharacterized protein HMPREF1541_01057 [Cyphellophora europaea CBS 101466]|uniref:FCP1 homology domain-containing protein n=1 Tax=Cyphellophora europaea (strain CBS 101466) TaxID=1220924 RepID=W2SFU4_CYPE1|nr:uncharacterized protein HMPREF1541_01057 [Cyphellophora europaea CBS 101466]ETN46868.1 hypothetical protein HMPREF1541_01057 [Cyphellophora europaea CBS 101466]
MAILAIPECVAKFFGYLGLPVTSEDAAPSATTTEPLSNETMTEQEQKSTQVNIPSRTSSTQPGTTQLAISPAPNTSSEAPPAARRGSKRSILTRSRNNSRSSRRSGRAARPADPKEPVPPLPQNDGAKGEKKSRSGFLAFLGNCCSPSGGDDEIKNDTAPVPVKKTTVPPAQAKAPRPTEATETSLEKDAEAKQLNEKQEVHDEEKVTSAGAKPDPEDEINEKVAPNASTGISTAQEEPRDSRYSQTEQIKPEAKDVDMPDAPVVPEPEPQVVDEPVQPAELQPQVPLPPPPPLSQRQEQVGTVPAMPEAPVEKQNWLLPPAQPPLKGRKCLILDLDETLVHSSFKILNQADFTIPVEIEGQYHNVYVIKRPGVDQFMKRVGELYEVVVFTASVSKYGDPLLDQLDIHHVVHHRLFRESCYNHQGNYVKDLSQVGRDLKETIIIDNSPTSYIFHPQHAVPISSWFSDAHDNELLDLIPVLEDLAGPQVKDVSLVLDVTL